MNAKMIVALKGIRDNLTIFIDEMENTSVAPVTAEPEEVATVATETPATKSTMSRKEREASEELPNVDNGLTLEQLNGLSYNNLKRLAKEMGIPATGARDELTQKILSYDGEVPNPDAVDEPEAEVASAKSPMATKSVTKKAEVAEDEGVDGSDDGDDDEEVDELVQKVNEAVEEMTNEEIMDILAEVGVKAKGKRQALIDAVIKAVREGKIDLDDEDEDEEEETEEVTTEPESEPKSEWDVNDPENPDMTTERKTAITAYESEIREDFENGNLTRAELVDWLNEFHGTKDTMKKKSDDDILDEYIYCSCLLIDDGGEMPEDEGAYTVNGIPYCCGHELSYNEDNETYTCSVCGGEYEAGEE